MAIAVNDSNFEEIVLKSEQPVLVDFWAEWCGPCKMLAPLLEQLASEMPEINILKIDVDSVPDVAKEYGIISIPTLILFKEGKAVDKQVGFMNINQLKSFVK